jgi:hypothetical protein
MDKLKNKDALIKATDVLKVLNIVSACGFTDPNVLLECLWNNIVSMANNRSVIGDNK